jgi:hypothetical protein
VLIWCAVAFIGRKTRSSGVLSRLFGEKRVFPAYGRVFPACCRVYPPKNVFIRRKTRLSPEKRVYPPLVQANPTGFACPRKETRCSPHAPLHPVAEVFSDKR